jgi:hypothetical protein
VSGLHRSSYELLAFRHRLGYAQLLNRHFTTTRGVRVGDSVRRLTDGTAASCDMAGQPLSLAPTSLFMDERRRGKIYTMEFDINHHDISFISAARRHVIQTFGECA